MIEVKVINLGLSNEHLKFTEKPKLLKKWTIPRVIFEYFQKVVYFLLTLEIVKCLFFFFFFLNYEDITYYEFMPDLKTSCFHLY